MTKHEHARRARLADTLRRLGFESHEVDTLRRISNALQRWYELECGMGDDMRDWCIERDDDSGKPYMVTHIHGKAGTRTFRHPVADREAGALRRLKAIMEGRPLSYYVQTDPRGAALYILRPGDVPEGISVESCYTRGVCVY